MVGDVIFGMVGGALGGTLVAIAGDAASFVWLVGSVVTALLGALAVIWLASFLNRSPVEVDIRSPRGGHQEPRSVGATCGRDDGVSRG